MRLRISKNTRDKLPINEEDVPLKTKENLEEYLQSAISFLQTQEAVLEKILSILDEIAGLESTGKSFLAAQIAANAQKQGINVVYFDSESAIDPGFLENAGCDLESLIYIQAESVEFVLETIEEFIGSVGENLLFIWDSIALTPCNSDIEGDFNPQSSMAVKARVLSKGLQKLTLPLANANSTLLALNQLKTNITRSVSEAMTEPLVTPGGKSLAYAYSLRIWLTSRKAKNSFVVDDKGYRIGSEVKTTLKKSRFGSQGRTCTFRILWGDSENIGVMDEESWFDAVKTSDRMVQRGAWYTLVHQDGTETKFQPSKWLEMLQDEKLKDVADVIKKYLDPFKPTGTKPKTPAQIEKRKKQKAETNAQIQALLSDDGAKEIIDGSVSKDEAQSKIKQFLSS